MNIIILVFHFFLNGAWKLTCQNIVLFPNCSASLHWNNENDFLIFLNFMYLFLAASGLSCKMQAFYCHGVWAVALQHVGS